MTAMADIDALCLGTNGTTPDAGSAIRGDGVMVSMHKRHWRASIFRP